MGKLRSVPTPAEERSAFTLLCGLQDLARRHLDFVATLEDVELLCRVGLRQRQDDPMVIKEAFLLGGGSVATVQRQLRRLRAAGVIEQKRSAADRRAMHLLLTPKALRAFASYAALLRAEVRRA